MGLMTRQRSILDPRIKQPVAEINKQVDHDVGRGEDENDALDDRVIPAQDGIDRQPAEARDVENGLSHNDAADEHLDSKWARQVGGRATEMVDNLRELDG